MAGILFCFLAFSRTRLVLIIKLISYYIMELGIIDTNLITCV